MRPLNTTRLLAAAAGLTLAMTLTIWPESAMAVTSANESFLQPMGPVAEEQATHLMRVIAITMIVILPVLIGVPLLLWRYRLGSETARYTPEWESSNKLELVLWGVPVIIVIVLASWLWYSTNKLDPYKPVGENPLQVQAIGLDWKWVFIYPDAGVATVNELAIPVGRPVELTLTTDTVMQSMLIAPLTGQIYAMPGMTTKLNFAATRTGSAEGENTQFNGAGFGRQKFTVIALEPDPYEAWVSSARDAAPLDDATYAVLRQRSVLADARADLGLSREATPLYFSAPDSALFERVVKKYHRPGTADTTDELGGTGLPAQGGGDRE
ncbi:cytochrome c oxidase subunit II [Henriciella litoralis]|uniref:cytochrome c oxidase subunit II n=1 Tax=Henriciella litoralis TaxID=568102 RepID=UPI0018F026DE|nr:cytochrome ubiquinol oxidase subunit II [Henriciella litoralis]